jgi:hypothetical protein
VTPDPSRRERHAWTTIGWSSTRRILGIVEITVAEAHQQAQFLPDVLRLPRSEWLQTAANSLLSCAGKNVPICAGQIPVAAIERPY